MDNIAKSSGEASGQTSAGQSGGGKSGKEFSSTTTKKVTKSAGASSVSDHSKVCVCPFPSFFIVVEPILNHSTFTF